VITLAGHSLAHRPHPTHKSLFISAKTPFGTVIALLGQTFMQHPQATHSFVLTTAFLLAMIKLLCIFLPVYRKKTFYSVTKSQTGYSIYQWTFM
jgi:phosphoglycerol transferase MdoB-like AlkP superfamily enzyme